MTTSNQASSFGSKRDMIQRSRGLRIILSSWGHVIFGKK